MIRVEKPARAPEKLRTDGKNKRRGLSAAYTRDPGQYKSGAKTFDFDAKTYGHVSVKQALIDAQHGKCCFCESKIRHIDYGDVEHFRPKAGYKQDADDELQRPGYYWLAYEWRNLYLSCAMCNQRHKANLFPLRDETARALDHHNEVADESPLFVDPGADEPRDYVGFRRAVACPRDGGGRGVATIAGLRLNRPALRERRKERYELFKGLHNVSALVPGTPEAERARELLDASVREDAEYSAMLEDARVAGFG